MSTNPSTDYLPFGDEAGLDVRAWYQARVRADASQRVAAERFAGAVAALRDDSHSVRAIARILEVPPASVYRQIARAAPDRVRSWAPLVNGVGGQVLAASGATAGEWLRDQWREAHNRAWSHYPPAQDRLMLGYDGKRIAEAMRVDQGTV